MFYTFYFNSTIYYDLLSAIDSKDYTIHSANNGVVIAETDEYKIQILSPTQDEYKDINHYSVILKLTYKENSFLFIFSMCFAWFNFL